MTKILRTNSKNRDFSKLIEKLDLDLNEINGTEQADYDKHNILDYIETVILVYKDKIPVACGAFKKYSQNSVEIKRIFVDVDYRRKGFSKLIMKELESWAFDKGYKKAILETGKQQIAAIQLYQSSGYTITENYPPYTGLPSSLCMAKQLK